MVRPGYRYSKVSGGLMRTKAPIKVHALFAKQKHKHELSAMGHDHHINPIFRTTSTIHLNPCSYSADNIYDLYENLIEHRHSPDNNSDHLSHSPLFCRRMEHRDIVEGCVNRDLAGASKHDRKRTGCIDNFRCIDDQSVLSEGPDHLTYATTKCERNLPTRRSRERSFMANESHDDPRDCCCGQNTSCRSPVRNLTSTGTDDCMPLNTFRYLDPPVMGLITFEAAAAKLSEVSEHAITFFSAFETRFREEIYKLSAYANRETIRAAWKDKILRNEKYNDSPKEGWARGDRRRNTDSNGKGNGGHQHDWSDDTNNSNADHAAENGVKNRHNAHGRLTTFGEHQFNLKRDINMLLNCQILEPRLRHHLSHVDNRNSRMSLDKDDYVELEDTRNIARYNGAHKLRQRVGQCEKDLLPLLHKIRDDSRYMEAALVELNHLASLLETYSKSWRRAAWTNNSGIRGGNTDHEHTS